MLLQQPNDFAHLQRHLFDAKSRDSDQQGAAESNQSRDACGFATLRSWHFGSCRQTQGRRRRLCYLRFQTDTRWLRVLSAGPTSDSWISSAARSTHPFRPSARRTAGTRSSQPTCETSSCNRSRPNDPRSGGVVSTRGSHAHRPSNSSKTAPTSYRCPDSGPLAGTMK